MKQTHKFIQTGRRWLRAAISAALITGLLAPAVFATQAQALSTSRADRLAAAAQEFKVPVELLLAVSYNESRWQPRGTTPSVDNGYGLMDLRAKAGAAVDGRGDASRPAPQATATGYFTLDEASALLNIPAETLKTDEQQNIRGAAAVLADYAKRHNNGKLPADLNGWHAAVADFSGSASGGAEFADAVYATVKSGAALTTKDGQQLTLKAQNVNPLRSSLPQPLANTFSQDRRQANTDCPRSLDCRFVPAGYAANSDDPADFGNYDPANRPNDMKIKYIVIHDTEGSYQSAISHFQDTTSYVSCNYVIRSSDGAVTQMVRNSDVAWCAGDWYVNMHSINIEHEGFSAQGDAWYTDTMYKKSAELVRHLAKKYDIPLDRQHIIAHSEVPTLTPARMAAQHADPGPYWDWNYYMKLLREPVNNGPEVTNNTKAVTIAPEFKNNKPVITPDITTCPDQDCAPLPTQGSNRIYLRTEPRADAPMLSDPYMHTDNKPGTTRIDDWSAVVQSGSTYALAEKDGNWTAVWYGGKKGWFYNPKGQGRTAYAAHTKVVTPKAGKSSVPVYGGAFPESSAYPSTIPDQSLTPIYQLPAGQAYETSGKVPTDYFYDATIDFSKPDDHMIVKGNEVYYQITFNHKQAFVKAADVDIK
jgi:hypothetical protein